MPISIRDDYPAGTRGGNTCSCCHAGRREIRDPHTNELRMERVVDLGETVDYEGFIMVCEQCVREAAGKLGMIEPTERDAAVADLHEVQAEADRLLAERDEAHQLVDLIRAHDEKRPSGIGCPPETGTLPEPTVAPARKRAARTNV